MTLRGRLARVLTGALPTGTERDALVGEVARVCDAHLAQQATVVVAVSGGPDSTALAYLLDEARPDLQLVIGHVRHGLRDDRADAALAADHAAALGVGYLERGVQVQRDGEGLEAAARRARYAALRDMARQVGADAVVVGHTADDQAETVLLNLARGSGLAGVSGMAECRDLDGVRLIRPLLRARRADVRGYVEGEGLDAISDPTNDDPEQRRARVRREVLPALARLTGGTGDPVGALTRLADLARDDADALDGMAVAEAARLVRRWGPARCLELAAVALLPVAVATRVLRLFAGGDGPLGGADAVATLLRLRPGEAAHLPGGTWVTCGGGWLGAVPADVVASNLPERPVAVPGTTPLPELGLVLCVDRPWTPEPEAPDGQQRLAIAEQSPALADAPAPPGPPGIAPPGARSRSAGRWLALPEELLTGLTVRSRRPGDRMRLAQGTRKLQDLFTDQGVPRAIRDHVPIVVDADGRPLWVPGVARRHLPEDAPSAARVWLAVEHDIPRP